MIEFIDVNYNYGKKIALKNVNLKIDYGTFNLFIGHNGSGKSTTIKLILNLIKNKKGKIIRNYKSYCYMPEKTILPDYITIE